MSGCHNTETEKEFSEKMEDRVSTISLLIRINEFEESYNGACKDIELLVKKVDELGTEINIVRALGSRAYHPKKPHKCPICNGRGGEPAAFGKNYEGNPIMPIAICNPCEGKGIVWG